ncbi:MAG: hypothetical protein CMC78_03155 [Flavobacteriaceae bacterium]|nr:hypothetical protein [Flavobacteriaceae bacterium]|tara:strand:- start:318 stop:935 length:618 start_codon:yes stop_codon:yes gene_type:complete
MATTTIDLDTELSAVNNILGAIGQSPLTTLNFDNPEVSFIYNLLRDANVDTQAEGWHFNTEKHVKYTPDANGKIAIGNDILSMDAHDNHIRRQYNLVRRSGFLYDKQDHTDDFSSIDSIDLDVVRLYNFEDLPIVFRRFITYRASAAAATQLVANPNLVRLLTNQASLARAALQEYECNQGDHNMFGFPDDTAYQTYQPWRNLRR